ncbi:MAG TPA: hypothetical protein VGB26_14115 [Nitrospiria bacterium]
MEESDWWKDFRFRMGPSDFGMQGSMRNIRYSRIQGSHIVRLWIQYDVKEKMK